MSRLPAFPSLRPLAVVALLLTALAAVGTAGAQTGQDPLGRGGFGLPGMGSDGFDAGGMGPAMSGDVVTATMAPAAPTVPQGGDLPLKIVLEFDPGWHVWTNKRPLDESFAVFSGAIHTELTVLSASPGLEVHLPFTEWPEEHAVLADIGDGPQTYAVFEGRTVIYVPVTVAADAPVGTASIEISIGLQACTDRNCVAPDEISVTTEVEIVPLGAAGTAVDADADFAGFDAGVFGRIRAGEAAPAVIGFDVFGLEFSIDAASTLGYVLLLLVAALGGFLLNFTPCVLPVIPLKIMGLSAVAGNPRRCFALGATMSIGVIAFWLALGGLIASFTWFSSVNQLFQMPIFTICIGIVIAVMAIGMAGFFSVGLPQWVYRINPSHETYSGSFGFGIMTAILSTPCTAPLMGAAAAWAATQSTTVTLSVFCAIGVGMALPYLVLSAFPHLVDRMPRTGPASDVIKQVMGLLLLAAAAYFIGAGLSGLMVTPPDPPSTLYWWFVAFFGAAAGAWLVWRTIRITPSTVRRLSFGGLGLVVLVLSALVGLSQTRKGPINWIYYTPERFAEAQGDGNVVVMDFTAEWCLNCKALETTMLYPRPVASLMEPEQGVVPIKVDLTGNNEMGNDMLRTVGRVTIPLLVVFAPDGTEVFKSDSYTSAQVIKAIEEAQAHGRGDTVALGD